MRYVVPKELNNSRDPVTGFVLQESATVNVRDASDFSITSITTQDYDFDRNPRFISIALIHHQLILLESQQIDLIVLK